MASDGTDGGDTCGYEDTTTGHPCQHPAGDNGRCWRPSHNPDDDRPNPDGRPSKLSYERQEKIAGAIENGKSIAVASRTAGITPQTFFNWMARGEDEAEGPYAEFFDRLTRALGYGQDFWERLLIDAAEDDPATIMSVLKTRFKETWGDVDRGEQTGGVTVTLGSEDTYEVDPDTLEVVSGDE